MNSTSRVRKIAFVGDHLPRKCGIATFTSDLLAAVVSAHPQSQCLAVSVNDIPGGYEYPEVVRFEIEEQDLSSYLRAADFLNISNVNIVCLQHEFGIFGGPAGGHILALLRELRMPAVTTLHTVLREPLHCGNHLGNRAGGSLPLSAFSRAHQPDPHSRLG